MKEGKKIETQKRDETAIKNRKKKNKTIERWKDSQMCQKGKHIFDIPPRSGSHHDCGTFCCLRAPPVPLQVIVVSCAEMNV